MSIAKQIFHSGKDVVEAMNGLSAVALDGVGDGIPGTIEFRGQST